MICPNCQTQQADGIRFCGKCGNPMPGMSAPAPQGGYPAPPGAYNSGPAPSYMSGPAGQPPPGQYQAYGMGLNANEPRPELHNPKEPILLADMRVKIEGEVVPVVSVELGTQQTLYFEHHILLWKHPGVNISMQARGGMKRLFAGLQVFISTAQGPGNIAFSREAPGQIVALRLRPGQMVEVREHQFLCASSNVNYDFTFVKGVGSILFSRTGIFIDQFMAQQGEGILFLHAYGNHFEKELAPGETLDVEPGGWLWKDASVQMTTTTIASSTRGGLMGMLGNLVAGASIVLNRFTGPGRIGIQSMTYHPPTPEGAQEVGGQSNLGFGQFFQQ
ncbi:MAG TPA: AIM24 family protein [Ktedonobacterales bacterium]